MVLVPGFLFGFSSDHNTVRQLYGDRPADSSPQPLQPVQQPAAAPQKAADTSLGNIIVTARNIPEEAALVARKVDVITEKEIKGSGGSSVADVIGAIDGLYIYRTGPANSLATLSLRGAGAKYTRVMIDGIPVNDILTGTADLSLLDTSLINRVEIVKGGMSSVYGANALAGVVNIISGSEDKKIIGASGSYSTEGAYNYSVSSVYRVFAVDYAASFYEERNAAYFENSDSFKRALKAKASFGNNLHSTTLSGNYVKREAGIAFNEFGPTPFARQNEEIFGAGLESIIYTDYVTLKANGFMRGSDLVFENPDMWYPVESRHIKKEYQGGINAVYGEGDFFSSIAGYEANIKTIESGDIGERELVNHAALLNASVKMLGGSLVVSGGTRVDINSAYGVMDSENIGVRFRFADGLEVRGSFEKAFGAPSFGDLYWPEEVYVYEDFLTGNTVCAIIRGNPDLKPEESLSFELSAAKKQGKLSQSLAFFYRDITGMISWRDTVDGITTTTKPENIDRAKVMGLEAGADYALFSYLKLSAGYSLRFIDDAYSDGGEMFVFGRGADNNVVKAAAELKLPHDITLTAAADYAHIRHDYKGRELEPYWLLGAVFNQKLNKNIGLFVKAENILDNREYEVVKGYPMPGRTVTAGVSAEF